jgi:hypothetical protein
MLIILWKEKYQRENITEVVDLEIKAEEIKYMVVMLPEHRTKSHSWRIKEEIKFQECYCAVQKILFALPSAYKPD